MTIDRIKFFIDSFHTFGTKIRNDVGRSLAENIEKALSSLEFKPVKQFCARFSAEDEFGLLVAITVIAKMTDIFQRHKTCENKIVFEDVCDPLYVLFVVFLPLMTLIYFECA